MKRFYPLVIVLVVFMSLISCQIVSSSQEEQFEPRLGYDEVKEGAFRSGAIPKEYVREDSLVKFRSTSGLYGYLYILNTSNLTVDWVIFENDGSLKEHHERVELTYAMDFDGDGVKDLTVDNGSLRFEMIESNTALFSYDFPDGIFYVTEDGGRVYETDPRRFEPVLVDGASPTATMVYYAKDDVGDLKIGDVIFDVASYPYLGEIVVRKVVGVKDEGDLVLVESTVVGIEDVIPVLSINYTGSLSMGVPLNDDARSVAKLPVLNHSGSKTLYSGKHATLTAYYGFGLDADFSVSTDYDWDGFDIDVGASLTMSHDMELTLFVNDDYKKSGESKPFFEPSFAFSLYGIPMVASFPIYAGYAFEATGTAVATVGYDLSAEIGGTASISGKLNWNGIDVNYDADAQGDEDADLVGPEYTLDGKMKLRLYMGVDVKVSVVKIGYANFVNHPYLEPNATAHFEGDPYPDGEIDTRINYGVDFSVKLGYDFKAKKGDWDKHLKDWKAGEFGPWTFAFPAPPSDLTGRFLSGRGAVLEWKDNSSYEDGYEITRKRLESGLWVEDDVFTADENATSYTDSTAQPMKGYKYYVIAYSDWPTGYRYRSSAVSVEIEGTPPPKPTDPNVYPSQDAASLTPRLSWRCDDETGDSLTFDLYLSTENPPETLVASEIEDKYYDVENALEGDTTYYWKVVVHDSEGFETQGDVWTFRTIPSDKRYLFIRSFDRDPYSGPITHPPHQIDDVEIWVDGNRMTTPATTLVTAFNTHEIRARYYPNTMIRLNRQWLFKEWVHPKKTTDPIVEVKPSNDTTVVLVVGEFLRFSLSSTEGGTASILTEGRDSFYEKGTELHLEAQPFEGYEFTGWYTADGHFLSDSESFSFIIEEPTSLLAHFENVRVDLSVDSTPISGVDVMIDGEKHTTPFTVRVVKGLHIVQLVESSDEDVGVASSLIYLRIWEVNGNIFDDNPLEINIEEDTDLRANMNVWHAVNTRAVPEDGGVVVISPQPYRGYSRHGEDITISVDPRGSYSFDHYSINGEDYYDNPYATTVENPLDITAHFRLP